MKPEAREALCRALVARDRAGALAAARALVAAGRLGVRHGLDAVSEAMAATGAEPAAAHDLAAEAIELLGHFAWDHRTNACGVIAVGTVAGDTYSLGKNLFAGYARCSGLYVVDLGIEASAAKFAGAVREHRPNAVAVLCHQTLRAGGATRVIEELVRQRLRAVSNVLLVGDALTHEFARDTGADGYAPDPGTGVEMLLRWLE